MMKKQKMIIVTTLIFCLVFSNLFFTVNTSAATKRYVTSLIVSKRSISLQVGQSKKIPYKVKVKKAASKKITIKEKNNIADVTVKNNNIIVIGKKVGTTKLIITTKAKNKSGKNLKTSVIITIKNSASAVKDRDTKKKQDEEKKSDKKNGSVTDLSKATIKSTARPTTKPDVIYNSIANGIYKINTKIKSNMLLDVWGNSSDDKTNIQIFEDNKSTAQQFDVTHIGNGWYKICSFSSGKALDVAAAEKKPGVNVQLYSYNGSDAQLWRFVAVDNEYYYIQNKLGYYLDVDGGRTENNTNVQVFSKNATNSQKWKLIPVIYPSKVTINPSSITLTSMGATKKMKANYMPSNATEKSVTWTSSDTKVAIVSNGTVKAVGSGSTTITVRTSNGKSASIKVTVNDGAAKIENGLYNINTKISENQMLDVADGKTNDGANIQIYQKNGSAAQKFKIESVGNGWYVISNTYPRKCLDVQGGSNKPGTNVLLYQYNKSDAQLWRFYPAGNGYYTMMNKLGCFLDVDGGIAQNGRNVQVYTKNDTIAQKWRLIKSSSDHVNIADSLFSFCSKVGSNFVLDVDGGKTADGTNIQIYKLNDSNAQKFSVQPTGDGWFKISNPLSGKCLDVKDGSKKSGVNVQLYSYNGTDAQKWRFYSSGEENYFFIKNKLGYYLDVDGGKEKNGTNVLVFTKNNSNAQKWKLSETSAIVLNTSSVTLDGAGKTQTLSVFYEPARVFAANKRITWSSSNIKVATVSNGVVKAVGPGVATITAKAFNGRIATATVTVKANSWSVTNSFLTIKGISMNEYKVGNKYTTDRYAFVNGTKVDMCGWQCCGYARYIQQKLYGCHEFNSRTKFKDISGVVTSGNLTAAKIQTIVNSAGVGAHIRTNSFNNTNQHSMIIIGITANGFTIADANSDGKYTIRVRTFTWSEYVSVYGKRGLEYVNKYVG